MVIIGAGPAGLVTAYICATVKAKTALIEKHKMGGIVLTQAVFLLTKALIRAAKIIHYTKRVKEFGLNEIKVDFNFANIMERVQCGLHRVARATTKWSYRSGEQIKTLLSFA